MDDRRVDSLAWPALLAHWMDVARASLALPDDDAGDRWRASVTPLITLQAVTFALGDLARVPPDGRPFARDQADVLVSGAASRLDAAWRGATMPESLLEIAADARLALLAALYAGTVELVWPGPEPMEMPAIEVAASQGTVAVMMPGTRVMAGEPVAWFNEHPAVDIPGCLASETAMPRQVYRQIDADGRVTGDVVAPVEGELPPGLPLLVPLVRDGVPIGTFPMSASEWRAIQARSMPEGAIPVDHRAPTPDDGA
ncbi:MAG: hypothetical protein KDA25_04255 [Phycisphaerales bacterium]|nr:hypothetical protein [Phycisphaerales bacterium]